ncbi:hypothetical protein TIFTF001_024245 [Ficus carica]|uniref:Uncharacterized protein n=1 Tax=Ficus carica TaxID=3494 RepID=A0AA88B0L8_FICCA|nr:hypothetical protein TIFTF001_024245 [Ficus carica]
MKISLALFVAFVLLASLQAKAKSNDNRAVVDDQLRSNSNNKNLGRKVNVGALNGIGNNMKSFQGMDNIEEEEDSDENEAFGKSGSDSTVDVHRTFSKPIPAVEKGHKIRNL